MVGLQTQRVRLKTSMLRLRINMDLDDNCVKCAVLFLLLALLTMIYIIIPLFFNH